MSRKKKQSKQLNKIKRTIVEVFRTNPNKTLNYKQASTRVGASDAVSRHFVQTALAILKDEGYLDTEKKGQYKLKEAPGLLEGTIDITQAGRAFVLVDGIDEEVIIPQNKTGSALQGDLVGVRVTRTKKSGRLEGVVEKVIERHKTDFVGVIQNSKNYSFVEADSRKVHVDFYVDAAKTKGAKSGEKVIVRMTDWPKDAKNPFAEVIEILGQPGNNDTEIHAILAEYGLPYDFPKKVESEAQNISTEITKEEIKKRKDLRNITTFTIDPEDAKDFDDALSVEKLPNGNWSIGIHIADVSHFVIPKSHLDKEAYKRGNSVYLVDRVVPMLPEVLSNGLCSLRPNEDKLAFSAVFELTPDAKIIGEWFGKTIINSNKRFVYEEAQEVLKQGKGEFYDELKLLNDFAKLHRKNRLNKGALDIESSEVRFRLNENGDPIELFEKVSQDTNKLVEEFMLMANRKVAEFVAKPKPNQIITPFVFRIHDQPNEEKIEELKKNLFRFGYKIKEEKNKPISYALNNVMQEAKANKDLSIIAPMCIKSMAKAVYSADNIGHYGLAFDYYTHFTSPIRRYADLMVHRILQDKLEGRKGNFPQNLLEDVCKHISNTEKQAVDAERASIKFMQVKYMQDKVGEVFAGRISGVTDWGIFIELIDNKCEGMIRLSAIEGDYYYFDSDAMVVRGQNTKEEFGLGDELMIKVKDVNLLRKQIEFELIDVVYQ